MASPSELKILVGIVHADLLVEHARAYISLANDVIRSKKDRRAPHARSARQQRHVYFSSLPFFALNSLWGGATFVLGRCLSLSQPRTPRRHPYLSTSCHAVSRRSSPGVLCRSGARWLLSASEPPLQPRLAGVSVGAWIMTRAKIEH